MTRNARGSGGADDRRDTDRSRTGRPERSGLLLAGGRSTRFGEPDKALAELGGAPLLCHTAAALVPVVDELVVNCREAQRDDLAAALEGLDTDLRFAVDPVPDEGPVAGLLTGLRVTHGRHVAVAGCDQPFLRTATVADLFDHATGATSAGIEAAAAPTGAAPLVGDRRQPLGAVYRQDRAREAAVRTMAAGSRALRDVVARVDPVAVPVAPGVVRDIDTHSDISEVSAEKVTGSSDNTCKMHITDKASVPRSNRSPSDAAVRPDGGES